MNNAQANAAHLLTLEENVKALEHGLAAKYLAEFADLFEQMPSVDQNDAKSILNVIDMWKQYRNVSHNNPEQIQAMITDLDTKAVEMQRQRVELEGRKSVSTIDLETLKKNGKDVAGIAESLVDKQYGAAAISLNTALASSLGLTIDCLKEQVSNDSQLRS